MKIKSRKLNKRVAQMKKEISSSSHSKRTILQVKCPLLSPTNALTAMNIIYIDHSLTLQVCIVLYT